MAFRRSELRVLRGAGEETASGPKGAVGYVDDGQLLAAVCAGDAGAAAALYDRARPVVDRTIVRLLGPRDPDHPDLAQLAMIELVRTVARYRGECPLDGWISTITAHAVYKQIRQRQVERRFFAGAAPLDIEPMLPAVAGASREVAARGLIARVVSHLQRMEPNRAWTFVLHDVHGYDLREIAAITNTSVAAAQTRLSRGRRELHEMIADDPELASALDLTGGGGS